MVRQAPGSGRAACAEPHGPPRRHGRPSAMIAAPLVVPVVVAARLIIARVGTSKANSRARAGSHARIKMSDVVAGLVELRRAHTSTEPRFSMRRYVAKNPNCRFQP